LWSHFFSLQIRLTLYFSRHTIMTILSQVAHFQACATSLSLLSPPNHMIPYRQTRSHNKRRRKSPRKPSPKRTKNTKSCICSGCNMSFDHNKKLLDHKRRSDNPKCSSDLMECQFCGTLALNEYGITVHQRSDIDCMRRQNAIDSTNIVLSDAGDGPLSKKQHQVDYNDERFEDAGLFEIYGSNVTDISNTKESFHDQDNRNKCAVSLSNTEELFVFDHDTLHHPSRTATGQRKRHLRPISCTDLYVH
jgi:hypothetical protein